MSTDAEKPVKTEENGDKDDHSANKGNNRRGGFGGRGGRMSMGGPPGRRPEMKKEGGPPNQMNQMQGGRGRGRGGFRGGRGGGTGGPQGDRSNEGGSFINERLLMTMGGSTADLPPQTEEDGEKKFNNKTRLYVGNLHPETTIDEFAGLFTKYGETSEAYINKEKNFGFIRLDYRSSAEKAKRELDGLALKQRNIRVRFAPLGSTIKVKNLTPFVTNELLAMAFSIFGEIERAHVSIDERGNSLKEGVVEFARKTSAVNAVRHCTEGCYFLTNALRPVIVELFNEVEDTEGFGEKSIVKKTQDFYESRSVGPRFAAKGSFEFEFGSRWKQIHELAKQKEEALKRELRLEEEKLEAQMQFAKYEHETEMLREELRKREMDRERQKREWEIKERQAEEQKIAEEESLRRHQEELARRMVNSDDELRRRQQENNLFVQAQQLSNLLDKQEDNRSVFKSEDGSNPEMLRHHYEENFQRVQVTKPGGGATVISAHNY
ncbi:unnamed protein product [Nesidiocoris tenuis]|uniref:RRM domain-containing protein n=1 Tax=Nesidiocoris tenuis TaxID=355587 RepID=A0A6H5GMW6_9HEMI|nr:unnamed protein product [Nesidiocoris tenuis]